MLQKLYICFHGLTIYCFLAVAYMLGIPITGYSLDIGREHTNLVDFKLQKRLLEGLLNVSELERYAPCPIALFRSVRRGRLTRLLIWTIAELKII